MIHYMATIKQEWTEPEEGASIDSFLLDNTMQVYAISHIIEWLENNVVQPEELGSAIPQFDVVTLKMEVKCWNKSMTNMQGFEEALQHLYVNSRYEEEPELYGNKEWPVKFEKVDSKTILTITEKE